MPAGLRLGQPAYITVPPPSPTKGPKGPKGYKLYQCISEWCYPQDLEGEHDLPDIDDDTVRKGSCYSLYDPPILDPDFIWLHEMVPPGHYLRRAVLRMLYWHTREDFLNESEEDYYFSHRETWPEWFEGLEQLREDYRAWLHWSLDAVEPPEDARSLQWEFRSAAVLGCSDRVLRVAKKIDETGVIKEGDINLIIGKVCYAGVYFADVLFSPEHRDELFSADFHPPLALRSLDAGELSIQLTNRQARLLHEARHRIDQALMLDLDVPPAFLSIAAACAYGLGRFADAADRWEQYLKVLRTDPGWASLSEAPFEQLHRVLGKVLLLAGNPEKALEHGEWCVANAGEKRGYYEFLAKVHVERGEFDKAIASIRREAAADAGFALNPWIQIALAAEPLLSEEHSARMKREFEQHPANQFRIESIKGVASLLWRNFAGLTEPAKEQFVLSMFWLTQDTLFTAQIRQEYACAHAGKAVESEVIARLFEPFKAYHRSRWPDALGALEPGRTRGTLVGYLRRGTITFGDMVNCLGHAKPKDGSSELEQQTHERLHIWIKEEFEADAVKEFRKPHWYRMIELRNQAVHPGSDSFSTDADKPFRPIERLSSIALSCFNSLANLLASPRKRDVKI